MSYWLHFVAMSICLIVLVVIILRGRAYPPIFAVSTGLCFIELLLWPCSLDMPELWYSLEIITVTSRVLAAIEAVKPAWDAWVGLSGGMFALAGVMLAWWRPMQANLWFMPLMRVRGFLWLSLAIGLAVVAAHQWTLLRRPGHPWRWHCTLLAVYFAEHAVFSFHLGPWFRAVDVHEVLSAGIYTGFAVVWTWQKKGEQETQDGKNCKDNHTDSLARFKIATSR